MFKHSLNFFHVTIFLLLFLLPWHLWYSDSVNLSHAMQGMSINNPLGTDALGRNQFYRLIVAICFSIPWLWGGVTVGTLAGLGLALLKMRERSDKIKKITYPLWLAIDLISAAMTSLPITVTCFIAIVYMNYFDVSMISLAISLFVFLRTYNLIFHEFIVSERLGHWQANYALGGLAGSRAISYGYLGEWKEMIFRNFTFHLKMSIIVEVSLSYLGFGIQEPNPSIGNMIASQMERYMSGDVLFLSVVIFVIWWLSRLPQSFFEVIKLFFSFIQMLKGPSQRIS